MPRKAADLVRRIEKMEADLAASDALVVYYMSQTRDWKPEFAETQRAAMNRHVRRQREQSHSHPHPTKPAA